ncbi:hypothetical protein Sjap_008542 [Stephania japonica]|uniref:Uncharacterized protein n=1 Tax=Stephania japonica TaxID=461633 RepID=A0AAP0PAZ2_9MAGN
MLCERQHNTSKFFLYLLDLFFLVSLFFSLNLVYDVVKFTSKLDHFTYIYTIVLFWTTT